jgi:16S rRNA (cytidine1402-2'-O)-methyltransferase
LSESAATGILYLIPATIAQEPVQWSLPENVLSVIRSLDVFIVENEKTARQFLKSCNITIPQQQLTIFELNKHQGNIFEPSFFQPLLEGRNTGLLSEAGCPAVADPGSHIVAEAHRQNIQVVPLTGPSSLLLALMASGLNGQQFAFGGYLPKERTDRIAMLKKAEKDSAARNQTQIFIETPYRNNALFDDILTALSPQTKLCIAADLNAPEQYLKTMRISEWKKHKPALNKRPAVWLFLAGK